VPGATNNIDVLERMVQEVLEWMAKGNQDDGSNEYIHICSVYSYKRSCGTLTDGQNLLVCACIDFCILVTAQGNV